MFLSSSRAAAANLIAAMLLAPMALAQSTGKLPVDYANSLMGTAPLTRSSSVTPRLRESSYTPASPRPGPLCPIAPPRLAPINANLALQYVAGVPATYYYPNRSIFGFSYGGYGGGPTTMPIVGD